MSAISGRKGRVLVPCLLVMLTLTPWRFASADTFSNNSSTRTPRSGAGLRVGSWDVAVKKPISGRSTESVAVQGWFQKGLDSRLVLENTLGFWERSQSSTVSGSFGTQTRRDLDTYLVPTMTALKMYPTVPPSSPLEPFIMAGIGAVLGIDREKVTSDDPLVTTGETTTLVPGLGLETGVGLDWRSKGAFGLTAGGRYQWATFDKSVGNAKLYRGLGLNVGLTYKFQND